MNRSAGGVGGAKCKALWAVQRAGYCAIYKHTFYVSLQCARDGNPDNMKRLLEVTSNVKKKVNQHDDEGLSALHYAARYNHYPIVVMLISAGASEWHNDTIKLIFNFIKRKNYIEVLKALYN